MRSGLHDFEREMTRLTEAIATGGQVAPLLDALKVSQAGDMLAYLRLDGLPVENGARRRLPLCARS